MHAVNGLRDVARGPASTGGVRMHTQDTHSTMTNHPLNMHEAEVSKEPFQRNNK